MTIKEVYLEGSNKERKPGYKVRIIKYKTFDHENLGSLGAKSLNNDNTSMFEFDIFKKHFWDYTKFIDVMVTNSQTDISKS